MADIARSIIKGSLVADAVNGLTRAQAAALRALINADAGTVLAPTNAVTVIGPAPYFSVGQATNIEVVLRATTANVTVKLWRYLAASDSFVLDSSFGVAGTLVVVAAAADVSVLLTVGAANGFFFSYTPAAGGVLSVWCSVRGSDGARN